MRTGGVEFESMGQPTESAQGHGDEDARGEGQEEE